jgi:hypothetical protein
MARIFRFATNPAMLPGFVFSGGPAPFAVRGSKVRQLLPSTGSLLGNLDLVRAVKRFLSRPDAADARRFLWPQICSSLLGFRALKRRRGVFCSSANSY